MTSHLNSHRTTDIKPEMLSGVQTGNGTPHDEYNIRGISQVQTNRKDDICMQRRLVQNFTYSLHIPSIFFPACCLLCFTAFFPRELPVLNYHLEGETIFWLIKHELRNSFLGTILVYAEINIGNGNMITGTAINVCHCERHLSVWAYGSLRCQGKYGLFTLFGISF